MTENTTTAPAAVETTGTELQIPSFAPKAMDLHALDYHETVSDGSGAAKLASSAVAPLVAAARGYSTVDDFNLDEKAQEYGFLPKSKQSYKDFKYAMSLGDAMFMPWYGAASLTAAKSAGTEPKFDAWQARPNMPLGGKDGAPGTMKYKFPKGVGTYLDVHPATPMSWIESETPVIFAEGLLKGDSTLTAMLLEAGVSKDELSSELYGEVRAARKHLGKLMEAVPVEKRFLIVSLVGVGTWHKSAADWNSLPMRGRRAIVAFDGDTATNRQVNLQAQALGEFLERRGTTEVTYLTIPPVNDDPKSGLDDYFAAGNGFAGLEGMCGDLPPTPAMKTRIEGVKLPVNDWREGITYEVKTVDVDGEQQIRNAVLIEAAMDITEVVAEVPAFVGQKVAVVFSGRVAWLEHRNGATTRRETTFYRKPMSYMESANATPNSVLSKLTDGRAAGVLCDPKAGRNVLNAWATSMQEDCETVGDIATTGLYTSPEGVFGFLTSTGMLTADGIDPSVRTKTLKTARTELEHLPLDFDGARRVSDAWDQLIAVAKPEINPVHTGIFDMFVGMAIASSMGLKPKGAYLLFTEHDSGKSSMTCMLGGWMGPEWHDKPVIKVKDKTQSVLSNMMSQYSNITVTIDDVMESGTASGSVDRQFETEAAFAQMAVRAGYETDSMREVMKQSEAGGYTLPDRLTEQNIGVIVIGEDLDVLNFAKSTESRGISTTTTKAQPLLARRGTVDKATAQLKKSKAQSVLMSALLTHYLVEFRDAVDPRKAMSEYMDVVSEDMTQFLPGVGTRSLELLQPVLAGVSVLTGLVARAKLVLADANLSDGRDYEAEADELEEYFRQAADDLVAMHARHKAARASKTETPYKEILNAVAEGISGRKIRLTTSSAALAIVGFDKAPDGELVGRIRKDGDIAIMPQQLFKALRAAGLKRFDSVAKLKAGLKDAIKKTGHKETIEGAGGDSRWLIDGKIWSEIVDSGDEADNLPARTENVVPIRKAPKPEKQLADVSGW